MKSNILSLVILTLLVQYINCCINGTQGCHKCYQYSYGCQICQNRYMLFESQCIRCSDLNCLKCDSNIAICTKCDTKYFVSDDKCSQCANGCSTCSQNYNNCTNCLLNFRLNNKQCQICIVHPKCKFCSTSTSFCDQCFDTHGANSGTCTTCSQPNCHSCDKNHSICTQCKSGFGISQINSIPTCIPCHQTCKICSFDYQTCTECKPKYQMIANPTTQQKCDPCNQVNQVNGKIDWCQTCIPSITNCLICYLNNSSKCEICAQNYGLSGYSCYHCTTNTGCQSCSNINYYYCYTCTPNYYLSGSSCISCSYPCLNCNSSTICTSCNSANFYLNTQNHNCFECPQNCQTCQFNQFINQPDCLTCEPGYGLKNFPPINCSQICGDFITYVLKCDNNITIQYDGCDQNCQIQNGFNCTTQNSQPNSTLCSYQKQLQMQVHSMIKQQFLNKINLTLNIHPPLHTFWDNPNKNKSQKQLFNFNTQKIQIISTKYLKSSQQFQFILQLKQSIINQTLTLYFLPSQQFDHRYYLTPKSQTNIHIDIIHFHPNYIFYYTNFVPYLCYTAIALTYASLFLGIIAKSLAGIQNLILIQIFWYMFLWLNTDLYIPFTQIYPLKHTTSFGIKLIPKQTPNQNQTLLTTTPNLTSFISNISTQAPHLQPFNFDQLFINNFNFQIIPQIITLIPAIILLILIKKHEKTLKILKIQKNQGNQNQTHIQQITTLKQNIKKLQFYQEILLQLTLIFTIFNLNNFITSTCIFFQSPNHPTINIIFITFNIIIFISIFIIYYHQPSSFDYFRFLFKNQFIPVNHLYFLSLSIISTILIISLNKSQPYLSIIPFTILFIYTIIIKPYKNNKDNIRSSIIIFFIITTLAFRIYLQFSTKPTNNKITFIIFFSLILLINIITFLTLSFLLYQIIFIYYLKNKSNKQSIQQIIQEINQIQIKQKIKYSNLSSSSPLKTILNKNMNILDFTNQINQQIKQQQSLEYQNSLNITKSCFNHEDLHSGRKLRKEMNETQYVIEHKNKTPTQTPIYHNQFFSSKQNQQINLNISQNVQQYLKIKNKSNKNNNQNIKIPKQCALGVLVQQNTFINVKNAQQYTNKIKSHSYKFDQSYLTAYNTIQQ